MGGVSSNMTTGDIFMSWVLAHKHSWSKNSVVRSGHAWIGWGESPRFSEGTQSHGHLEGDQQGRWTTWGDTISKSVSWVNLWSMPQPRQLLTNCHALGPGEEGGESTHRPAFGALSQGRDWVMRVDTGKQLQFLIEITSISLHLDIVFVRCLPNLSSW